MNNQIHSVRLHRKALLARVQAQREKLSGIASEWERPLMLADQGWAIYRFLRARPLLVTAVAALLVMRRRGILGLGKVVWKGWKLYRLAKTAVSNTLNRA